MKLRFLPALMLLAAPALRAQDPHVGFSLNLILPTGDYSSKTYPTYYDSVAGIDVTPHETYDLGLGANLTFSFPVDRSLAIRLNVGGSSVSGRSTSPGVSTLNLRHSEFNLGGDLQIFPAGTAYRHRGFYFVGGISADFERFERSEGDPGYDYTYTERKSRMGGTLGVGHSFGYDSGARFTLEATFHKTLTGNHEDSGDPPSADYVKVGLGFVF